LTKMLKIRDQIPQAAHLLNHFSTPTILNKAEQTGILPAPGRTH